MPRPSSFTQRCQPHLTLPGRARYLRRYVTKTVLSAAVAPSIESAAASADRFYMPLMTKPPALAKNTYFHNPLILGETHVYGIDEIDAPPKYKVVASGVRLPLEVFKTPGGSRGWGVRCTEFIPGGTFVCEYAGHLLTHADAVRAARPLQGPVPPSLPAARPFTSGSAQRQG